MRTACLFLTTAILGGCVGNVESKETKVKLSELTSSELNELCQWIEDSSTNESADPSEMCELAAVNSAEDGISCNSYYEHCLNALPESGVYHPGAICAKKKKTVPKGCTATVHQLKACFTARQQEIVSAAKAASCWDLANSRMTGSKLVSCSSVLPACEGMFSKHTSSEVEGSSDGNTGNTGDTGDDDWTDDSSDDDDYGSDDDEADAGVGDAPDDEGTGEEAPADAAAEPNPVNPHDTMTSHMDGGTH